MKDRFKAFSIHLLLSVIVLSVTLALVAFVWYPAPLFWADGGREVIQLIAAVDVVVGPSLTFVVYQKGKKSLKFDLAVIAALQLAALTYGSVVMYQQRPVFVAFALDKFYTVTAAQIDAYAPRKLKELGELTPHAASWVYVALPAEFGALRRLLAAQKNEGEPVLSVRSDLYQPLDRANLDKIFARKIDVLALVNEPQRASGPADKATLQTFLDAHRAKVEELAFIPFVARYQQMFAVYRISDASLIGYLEVRPNLIAPGIG